MTKYVITGGPGVGKSTTIRTLKRMGYTVIPEVAQQIIQEQLTKGGKTLPWLNRDKFQKEVMKKQLKLEARIKQNTFVERGLPDGIAYYKLDKLKPPQELTNAAKQNKYTKIFLLEPLNRYEKSRIRREDQQTAQKIHTLIHKTYKELGYTIIKIPNAPKHERAKMIIKQT